MNKTEDLGKISFLVAITNDKFTIKKKKKQLVGNDLLGTIGSWSGCLFSKQSSKLTKYDEIAKYKKKTRQLNNIFMYHVVLWNVKSCLIPYNILFILRAFFINSMNRRRIFYVVAKLSTTSNHIPTQITRYRLKKIMKKTR